MRALYDLTLSQLEDLAADLGEPRYRARQVWAGLYRRLASSLDDLTELPLAFRRRLGEAADLRLPESVREVGSLDGLTQKALLRLDDGQLIESVLMLYDPADLRRGRATVCVSTQVGCPIGCPFCATGQMGLLRNLSPGEIIAQVLHFARRLPESASGPGSPGRVTNVVFMGMGEPLLNYAATWQAVETLNSASGYALGARRMTISTSGMVPGILRLAGEPLQVNLAVSLHAPNDGLRDRLVPINRKYPVRDLVAACRAYIERTGRRVSFEYVLIDGVNDSLGLARELGELLRGMLCHVNLIPVNPTSGLSGRPSREKVVAFQQAVQGYGIPTTVRVEKGVEISAACGQLRTEGSKHDHRSEPGLGHHGRRPGAGPRLARA